MFVPSLLLFIYSCQIRENDFQDFIQDSNSRRSIRNQLSKVIFNFQGTNLILLSPGSFFFIFGIIMINFLEFRSTLVLEKISSSNRSNFRLGHLYVFINDGILELKRSKNQRHWNRVSC